MPGAMAPGLFIVAVRTAGFATRFDNDKPPSNTAAIELGLATGSVLIRTSPVALLPGTSILAGGYLTVRLYDRLFRRISIDSKAS